MPVSPATPIICWMMAMSRSRSGLLPSMMLGNRVVSMPSRVPQVIRLERDAIALARALLGERVADVPAHPFDERRFVAVDVEHAVPGLELEVLLRRAARLATDVHRRGGALRGTGRKRRRACRADRTGSDGFSKLPASHASAPRWCGVRRRSVHTRFRRVDDGVATADARRGLTLRRAGSAVNTLDRYARDLTLDRCHHRASTFARIAPG